MDLAVMIYAVTGKYPQSEIYAMTNQMRRAAYSIPANIAEGFGRFGTKEKLQFYKIAAGSLTELKSFCYLSERLHYIDSDTLAQLLESCASVHKQINALIRSIKERQDA